MGMWAALCGAGAGFGLWRIARGAGRRVRPPRSRPRLLARLIDGRSPLQLAAVVAAAAVAGLATRWLVGAVYAGLAVWALPGVLRGERRQRERIARLEAIATWTESLRDTLAGAHGLEQTILAAAVHPAAPIRAEVTALATAIRAGVRLPVALQTFADHLDDPVADTVVAVLILAATRGGRQLAPQLGLAAKDIREQAAARRRSETDRAKLAAEARLIVVVTMTMTVGLLVFNRTYLAVYAGVFGQIMLLLVGGMIAGAFAWMNHLGRGREPQRVLGSPSAAGDTAAMR